MSSNENWGLLVRKDVDRKLGRFSISDRTRLIQVIEGLPADPFAGDIQKMKGEQNSWRRRVGAYRIFYEIVSAERVIYVFHVERRKSNTY